MSDMDDSAGVEFVGGPAHGRLIVIKGDPPPLALEVPVEPAGQWYSDDTNEPLLPRRALYERRVNMDPSGPRWLYDHVSTR